MIRQLFLAALVLLAGVTPAAAVTDEEIFREFRFNLLNPGARALGLGGAFISLADDATAAVANPSGMSQLTKPEFFGELRFVDNVARSSTHNETLPAGSETFVATGTDVSDQGSFSFLSAVVPFNRWTVGFSLQDVLNVNNSSVSSFAFTFPRSPGAFLAAGTGSVDASVRNFNTSFGVRVTERFRVGGTLTYSKFDVQSEVLNSVVDTGAIIADTEILEPKMDTITTIDDSDDDLSYSLGVLYRQSRDKWGAGAVYRRGPRFTVIEQVTAGEDLFGVTSPELLGQQFENEFNLPDSVGIGGHYRLLKEKQFTLSLNVERIRYSNLLDGFVPGVNILTSADAEFEIDDATDYRFGADYLWLAKNNTLGSLSFRGGVFLESDATITARFTGSEGRATEDVFSGGGDQYHLTLGLGLNFLNNRWKIDMAGDFSELDNEYLLSVVFKGK